MHTEQILYLSLEAILTWSYPDKPSIKDSKAWLVVLSISTSRILFVLLSCPGLTFTLVLIYTSTRFTPPLDNGIPPLPFPCLKFISLPILAFSHL